MRTLTIVEAVREALREEMARDERVVVLGEDVGPLGGVFRATDGLLDQFGPERVIDTPMMELGIAGIAVGMAMRGLRPVAEIQFADFMHAAADHVISDAARIRFRTNGDAACPLVIRTAYGGGLRGGPYHSQSVEAYYAHVPGLRVVAASFPADAKGLLTAAIRHPDPVLFLEHKRTYRAIRGDVPEGEYVLSLDRANVVRRAAHITVVAWGWVLHEALAAADELAAEGIAGRSHRSAHAEPAGHRHPSGIGPPHRVGCVWCTKTRAPWAWAPRLRRSPRNTRSTICARRFSAWRWPTWRAFPPAVRWKIF